MNYRAEYEKWLDSPALSEREWKELHDIRNDEKEKHTAYEISVCELYKEMEEESYA